MVNKRTLGGRWSKKHLVFYFQMYKNKEQWQDETTLISNKYC